MTALAATGSWSRRTERPGGSPRPRRASFAWYPAYGGEIYLPPQPGPRRCYAWGRSLREIPDVRPERVALMASGGMSHYPGTDRYASPAFDWDRQLFAALAGGRGSLHRAPFRALTLPVTPRPYCEGSFTTLTGGLLHGDAG